MIGGFVKFVPSNDWLCIRLHCSINICFTFLTAGWYVVTKGNKRWWPFGYPDRDLPMMFSEYPLALRRCLNFKRPFSNAFLFGRVSFKQSYCLPLMKPYFTPGGWHHRRPKLTSREKAINHSWRRHALCDSVLSFQRNCWKLEHVIRNSMGNEIWSIYNDKYFEIWTFYS